MRTLSSAFLFSLCLFPIGNSYADNGAILSDHSYWYSWIDFAPDQVDPELARQKLDDILSPRGQDRLELEVEGNARKFGVAVDAAGFDWRDHIYLRWEPHAISYFTMPQPPLPANWFHPDFAAQQHGWVRRAAPVQMSSGSGLRHSNLVRAAYYRACFVLDQEQVLMLNMTYRGGIRVFINGREILRRHLPDGELAADTPAEGYPRTFSKGYLENPRGRDSGDWMEREINQFHIPADSLQSGRNVIAIENRAPYMTPEVVAATRSNQVTLGDPRDRQTALIPPCRVGIEELLLSPAIPPGRHHAVRRAHRVSRPPGVQLWAGDVHEVNYDTDFLEPGAEPGEIRVVGAGNGRFSGKFILGSSEKLDNIRISASTPTRADGAETAAVPTVRIAGMTPREPEEELFRLMGNHRGDISLGRGRGGALQALIDWRSRALADKPALFFDQISDAIPSSLPAGSTQPFWVYVDIPAAVPRGIYESVVTVTADGGVAASLPLRVLVVDWSLPDPGDYRQDIWIEQSPYGIARAFDVEPWSEEHWQLVESSLRQLARIGIDIIHIPVLQHSEFGNVKDAMIRWSGNPATEAVELDFSVMNRYLDIVERTRGKPKILSVNIMQGAGGDARGRASDYMDNITTVLFTDRQEDVDITEHPHLYGILARATIRELAKRGWEDVLHWGHFWDQPPNPELFNLMAEHAPGVYWARAGHVGGGVPERVRAQSEIYPTWPNRPEGVVNTVNPRRHSVTHLLEGYFLPFAFRIFPNRAVYSGDTHLGSIVGYTGIGRLGADYWDAWGRGNNIRGGVPDFGVKNMLWPGDGAVDSSQRFEMLREGVQETEAWLYLQAALRSGQLPDDLARRVEHVLARPVGETSHVPASFYHFNSVLLQDYPQGWQQRSIALYATAAEAARHLPAD